MRLTLALPFPINIDHPLQSRDEHYKRLSKVQELYLKENNKYSIHVLFTPEDQTLILIEIKPLTPSSKIKLI